MSKIFNNSKRSILSIYKNCLENGAIHVFKQQDALTEIISYSKEIIAKNFENFDDPQTAQNFTDVKKYIDIVSKIKQDFTNSKKTELLMQNMLYKLNLKKEDIYFDKPKIRVVTFNKYLESGVGYAYKPHRDSWYAGPISQLNFWFPIFDIDKYSTIAFYPDYWTQPITNTSSEFDYELWKKKYRKNAKDHIKIDSRKHPLPIDKISSDKEVKLVCDSGDMIVFSGCHLHGTVPNTSSKTRFSIDFRILSKSFYENNIGKNIDTSSTGSTVQDFANSVTLNKDLN